MVRAKLWFRCAALHDPVTPLLVRPAVIGWEGRQRKIDLTLERPFSGRELALRMKGWVTADVRRVVEVVEAHGFLKLLDERFLVVETDTEEEYAALGEELARRFAGQVELERLP